MGNAVTKSKTIFTKTNLIKAGSVAMMLAMTTANAFATGDIIVTSYNNLIGDLFTVLRGLFVTTACFVALVALFKILWGSEDRDATAGVRRIKICIGCVIGAWLLPPLFVTIHNHLTGIQGIDTVKGLTNGTI